jgi:hypothetical protein
MAKSDNVFEARLREIDAEVEKRTKALQKLQDKLRADPDDASTRAQIHADKLHLFRLADERGELARAVSRLAGGKQHTLPPT